MSDSDSQSNKVVEKKKYRKLRLPDGVRLCNSYKRTQKLKALETSLKNTLASLYTEIDRLDIEWLHLCNIAVPTKVEPSQELAAFSDTLQNSKAFDNAEVINSVALDLGFNLSNCRPAEHVEEYDSE